MRPVVDPALVEPDAEVPPPEEPRARAPSRRRRSALQRLVPPPPAGDPLIQRMYRPETQVMGVTSDSTDRPTSLSRWLVAKASFQMMSRGLRPSER
ncbi:unnamed protein product [Linum trigynum]|uniref:Uncharacterized protein n=1 Tax=Linum trigynum TaxID=586398 RepID=A0AAV2D932_9ROSI